MIKKLIAHQIFKEQHTKVASVFKRDAVLPESSDLSEALFGQLQTSFRSHSPAIGQFSEDGGIYSTFQQLLDKYIKARDQSEAKFVEMTRVAMDLLKKEMEKQLLATGGYAVFAEYSTGGESYFLIALLSTKAQPTFDKNLNLVATITPNLTNLRHAARIRLSGVQENEEGVVQFISERAARVSDYFVEFLGCEEITRPDVQGRILHTVLKAWADTQGYDDEQRSRMMGQAYEYWERCRKDRKPMTLMGIAHVLEPEQPDPLLTHLTGEGNNLSGEFSPPPPHVMKKFVRFAFNGNGLKIEYDRNVWGNDVDVSAKDKTLVIRNVPDKLIKQLLEEND